MNSDEKLKIEFIELISASLFMLFGLNFLIAIILSIYCSITHYSSADSFGGMPFIIILVSIIPWYLYGFYINSYIESPNLDILWSIAILFSIVTFAESIFYTFLYYRNKNTYKIISTNGKKVGFLKVFMRNILKSINRQFLCIGFVPTILGQTKLLYDTILNTDIISKDEYK